MPYLPVFSFLLLCLAVFYLSSIEKHLREIVRLAKQR